MSNEIIDKRLKKISDENDDLSYQNKFKESYQSLSGVLSSFNEGHSNSHQESENLNESNSKGSLIPNSSFRTFNSRLQLQDALPMDNMKQYIKGNEDTESPQFYIDSDIEENSNDDAQFHPQPLVQQENDDDSMDQVINENDDELELFRETRKGYFEALYLETNDYESSTSNKNNLNNESSISSMDERENDEDIREYEHKLKESQNRMFLNILSFDVDDYKSLPFLQRQINLFRDNGKRILKFSLAYFIAMILCTIPKCRKWLTHNSSKNASLVWFLPLAVIIHHPAHFFSIQIEITLQAIVGGMLGLSWSLLALFVATSNLTLVNNTHGSGALLWLSMFLATIFSYWLSNTFRRLLYVGITFSIATIYYHSINLQKDLFNTSVSLKIISSIHRDWKGLVWPFAVPYIIGLALSLCTSLLVFPEYNNQSLLDSFNSSMFKIGDFFEMINDTNDQYENILRFKQDLVNIKNFDFINEFVEHGRVFKLTHFSNDQLKLIRDHLIELTTLIRSMALKEGYYSCFYFNNNQLSDVFEHDLRQCLTLMQQLFKNSSFFLNENTQKVKEVTLNSQKSLTMNLKTIISIIDERYENFDIIKKLNESKEEISIDTTNGLLLIKSIRSIAKHLIALSLDIQDIYEVAKVTRLNLQKPTLSFATALRTLFRQCQADQGSGDKYDTIHSIEETERIMDEIYNTYTSKYITSNTRFINNEGKLKIRKTMMDGISRNRFIDDFGFIRASSSLDFRSKTSVSDMRFLFWKVKNTIFNDNLWYGLKVSFVMTFFLLPAWLLQSFEWFSHYQIYTCTLMFHILNNKNNIGGFEIVVLRLLTCFVGCFLGFVANVMKPFSNYYIVCWLSVMLVIFTSHLLFNHQYSKNGTILLLTFTIIVCTPLDDSYIINGDDDFSKHLHIIWKDSWITSLGLFIASIASVLINWVLEPKSTYVKITESVASIIKHLGDDYQLIVDRFLYKDYKDETTVLDNEFSMALELKITKEVIKLENLILKSMIEHHSFFHKPFDKIQYLRVFNTCKKILENLIQARQEVQYFDVYNADLNVNMTLFLSTFRISSVSSCCYNFFLLSNSFKNNSKLPAFLPNTILSRKKLYDKMALIETQADERLVVRKMQNISNDELVHGMAFSQVFTDINKNLEKLIIESKKILGEDIN